VLGYFERFEAMALDFLLRLRGQIRSPEIVLVQIDEVAFRNLGERQPIPRAYLAGLIEVLARGGATVIGLDVELQVATDPREYDMASSPATCFKPLEGRRTLTQTGPSPLGKFTFTSSAKFTSTLVGTKPLSFIASATWLSSGSSNRLFTTGAAATTGAHPQGAPVALLSS